MRFEFGTPWVLGFLALIPVVLVAGRVRSRREGLGFPSAEFAAYLPSSLRRRTLWIPRFLAMTAMGLLCIAAAAPRFVTVQAGDRTEGVAIEIVVDRSGSMGTEMPFADSVASRLDVVLTVVEDFVFGDGERLAGRSSDLIGVVTFARYADTVYPLSLSRQPFREALRTIRPAETEAEDGTSIGDALALAAARLYHAGEDDPEYRLRGKAIILLTDGENNAGSRTPEEAARLAAEWGIRVYAIGVGTGESYLTVNTPFGKQRIPTGNTVDFSSLQRIAEITDGRFWTAGDEEALEKIYREIDEMEKVEIPDPERMQYDDRYLPFVLGALGCLLLSVILSETVHREVP